MGLLRIGERQRRISASWVTELDHGAGTEAAQDAGAAPPPLTRHRTLSLAMHAAYDAAAAAFFIAASASAWARAIACAAKVVSVAVGKGSATTGIGGAQKPRRRSNTWSL